ncbi:unnamed protein product [Paramecium primaurelia]|uniref:Oxidation resistance protein 1 n=1 Tax=Paramecium primaurelia TaxID=5886 RepID=A0A8S1QIN3_PARPR|nr:unnamed protein product [Paramecium primaurelia]
MNQEQCEQQYDYELNFEYLGNCRITYENYTPTQEEEVKLSDLDSQFLDNFKIEDDSKYFLYKVESDDSYFGLELKFNVRSADQLMQINQISENSLYEGITIKIPRKQSVPSYEQIKNQEQKQENLLDSFQYTYNKFFDINYVTTLGYIKGKLTVHEDVLFFDPDYNNLGNEKIMQEAKLKNVQQLQFQILLKNVIKVTKREFPACIQLGSKEIFKMHFIEIHLQTKRSKVALIQLIDVEQLSELMDSINSVLVSYFPPTPNKIIETPTKPQLKTLLPFYYNNDQKLEQNIQLAFEKLMGSNSFISYLNSESEIIDQTIFMMVACYIPTIFKSQRWTLLYSSTLNGSSIKTLMRNTQYSQPVVLFIRDLDKYLFGAYLSDGIQKSQDHFYGTGESFLFTFKNTQSLTVYNWINQNNFITLCDENGLAIGCGDKYGLYVDSEIYHGYSHYCETFGNEVLSSKENFVINRMEIWGIIQG